MAKIDRALIIRRLENEISIEYAQTCVESCEKHGLPYELIDAIEHVPCDEAFKKVGTFAKHGYKNTQGNCCCHASHIKCWKRIIEIDKPCIVLEHDAIVKGDVRSIDIPDMAAVTFGHRVAKVDDYEPIGPIKELIQIRRAIGVHACALTPVTAKWLWEQAKVQGVSVGVDKYLMMQRKSGLPLYVPDPEQVVCWARVSTSNIQQTIQLHNYPDSFSPSWKKGLKI